MSPYSVAEVHNDDSSWVMRFEIDFDGVYPIEWLHLGFREQPNDRVRDELERRAYAHFHERGGVDYDDSEDL